MALKKPKPFKRKVFEKDTDEHFIVIVKPYREGNTGPWVERDTTVIAEWLRRATGSKRQPVHAVYTLSSRDEVIAKLSPEVDISKILGRHTWIDFLTLEYASYVVERHLPNLGDFASDIFEYNFKHNGDPGTMDAMFPRKEWIVKFDSPFKKFPVLADGYPSPDWVEPVTSDFRLKALILPIPRPRLREDVPSVITIVDDDALELDEQKRPLLSKLEQQEQKPIIVKAEGQNLVRVVVVIHTFKGPFHNFEQHREISTPISRKKKKPKVEEPPPSLIEALKKFQTNPPTTTPVSKDGEEHLAVKSEEEIKPPPQSLIDALAEFERKSREMKAGASSTDDAPLKGVKREADHHFGDQSLAIRSLKRPKQESDH